MNTLRETLTLSRELVPAAMVLQLRAHQLCAHARREIEDHRYLLSWALSSWELAKESTSHSRLDDAAIRDFARYRRAGPP